VRIIRKASEEAAGLVETDYFDLVFIDADHTFEAARRDIQVWRRRVRPNGGVMAGHDFSLFHPAVSLAVVVECSARSSDAERFPLQAEDGKPIIHLSADSVWWVVRS
jgi:predicted O-methyltransferase YrrM